VSTGVEGRNGFSYLMHTALEENSDGQFAVNDSKSFAADSGDISLSNILGADASGIYYAQNDVFHVSNSTDQPTKVFDALSGDYNSYKILGRDTDGDGANDQTVLSIRETSTNGSDFRISEVAVDDGTQISFGSAEYAMGGAFSSQGTLVDQNGMEITPEAVFDTTLDMDGLITSLGMSASETAGGNYWPY
jgi:hypothetical protein